jgi:S-formylglutathione hydrolase FrmB
MSRTLALALLALGSAAGTALAQHGRLIVDTVRSALLEDRCGDSPFSRVSIYVPPSYDGAPSRRYPVVYLLHGFGVSDTAWGPRHVDVAGLMDSLIAARASGEMIVVMPSASNCFGGSFYVNSITGGRWEDFISGELAAYIDLHYRTLARPESRGIAGSSMGGFGALYLGMRFAGTIYGAIYALSACCTHAGTLINAEYFGARWDAVAALPSLAALDSTSFVVRLFAAQSAAFSPDTTRPPLFVALGVVRHGDEWRTDSTVLAEWDEHSPLLMLPRYRAALLGMRGIAFDIGLQDQVVPPAEVIALDSAMTRAKIPHRFETYPGGHANRIRERLATRVMPFFTKTLVFEGRQ